VFNNPPDIVCGSTRNLVVGQAASARVVASDLDAGQSIELNAVGMPSGATMAPGVPVFGNPVSSLFTWVPDGEQVGTSVIIFTARDSAGQQSLCSLTVNVLPRVETGKMTGGGALIVQADGRHVTHGMQIDCNLQSKQSANLQVNWPGNAFHLEEVTAVFCATVPGVSPMPPRAGFNLQSGSGIGRLNGSPASIKWSVTDAGEPGSSDTAEVTIRDVADAVVLSVTGKLDTGNHQAHK
jgi:hypothetical protein